MQGGEERRRRARRPAPLNAPLQDQPRRRHQFGIVQRLRAHAGKRATARPTPRPARTPIQLTTTLDFNQMLEVNAGPPRRIEGARPGARPRTCTSSCRRGCSATSRRCAQCTGVDFATIATGAHNLARPTRRSAWRRSRSTNRTTSAASSQKPVPVFNLEPAPGEPARFGFELDKVPIVLEHGGAHRTATTRVE